MTDMELIKLAEEAGFRAAVIPAKEIPVDGSFRKFCEDNLCGKYNANYSCPPACGTVEEVHLRLFAQDKALVVEIIWDVNGFDDKEFIFSSRNKLNRTVPRHIVYRYDYGKFRTHRNLSALQFTFSFTSIIIIGALP